MRDIVFCCKESAQPQQKTLTFNIKNDTTCNITAIQAHTHTQLCKASYFQAKQREGMLERSW